MKTSNQNNEFGTDLILLIEENLNLEHWNFHFSSTNLGDINGIQFRKVIYDSEWCRIQFSYSRRMRPDEHELNVYYGRLHASSDESFLIWKDEKCWCWHDVSLPLFFLDDLSPSEVLDREKSGKLPSILEKFWQSDLSKKLKLESGAKIGIIKHSIIWENYGVRLFQLFDLRHPDIWEKYAGFLKNYYELKDEHYESNRSKPITSYPSRYKVC